jgi:hypothetical protein
VASEAARQIAIQPDPLLRYDMLINLHQLTSIPVEFLWETVVRLAAQVSVPVAGEILSSASWMRAMRSDPAIAEPAITDPKPVVEELTVASEFHMRAGGLLPICDSAPAQKRTAAEAAASWQ